MQYNKIFSTVTLFFILVLPSWCGEVRTWVGSNGKKIEAEFISYDKDSEIVVIRLANGKENRVKLDLFSNIDKEYVINIGNTDNPFGESETADAVNAGVPKLSPGNDEKKIAKSFVQMLNEQHVSGKQFDKIMAEQAVENYMMNLDPMKVYFLKSDVDGFQTAARTLPEKLEEGDMSLAFNVYNRCLQRMDEAINIALEILNKPLDFTIDEEYVLDKDSISFVKDSEELKDRWRKKLKYEILQMKTNLDKTEKIDPTERLKRRYESLRKRMVQTSNDDALESFLSTVGSSFDIHTSYMSRRTMNDWKIGMEKKLEGIGATLMNEDGYTVVKKLTPGGPAQKSGELDVEDKIVGVGQSTDGEIEDVVDMRLQDVVAKVRGKGGSVVRLDILKTDGTKRIVEITRGVVNLDDSKMKTTIFESGKKKDGTSCKIGFIRTTEFYQGISEEIKKELQKFKRNKVDGVILDLSINGGGSFHEIINTVGLFIETGPVVQTKSRNERTAQVRNDSDPSIEWEGPLVILSSKFCAVEMLLESMKDYHRALIVGDSRSNGKTTMQQMKNIHEYLKEQTPLGVVKMSIQTMYSPSGRSYCRGAEADIVLPSVIDIQVQNESELKNWVEVENIPPARQYPDFHMVTDEIIKTLKDKSSDRIKTDKGFTALQKEIDIIKKAKERKSIFLNEEKFAEEVKTQRERDSMKISDERLQASSRIIKDYYVDEVLAITVDYVNLLP